MLYLHIVSRENIKIMSLNLSVLPFYDSLEEQNSKKSYAYGDVYPLYMPKGVILPFQIFNINIGTYAASHRWWVVNVNTAQATEITTFMDNWISVVAISTTKENIIFYGNIRTLYPTISIGRYYLRLDLNYGSLYSDIITFVNDSENYICLEWFNIKNLDCEVGTIVYELQDDYFKNRLYLATELGKPDYVLTEEGEERNGYFFPIKQISEKTYKFNFLSCEYLLDVLRLIHLADYIKLTDIHSKTYSANEFKIEYEWQEQGNLAAVTATFQTEAIIKKIATNTAIIERDYFNNQYFHNVVNNISTKSITFAYPYSVDTDNLNYVGYVDENAHIEVWKDADENYYIINPTNIDIYFRDCNMLFYDYRNMKSLKWSQVCKTDNVSSTFEMFCMCRDLENLDLSSFNTENVTSMEGMFSSCLWLQNFDLRNFNTKNVTNMRNMFSACRSVANLDLSNFNTENVTNMFGMFELCESLTTIISRTFTQHDNLISERMFNFCRLLTGGNGTTYNQANITAVYARVDGENNLPGYFTAPS